MEPRPSSSTDDLITQSLPKLAASFAVLRKAGPISSTDDPKQSLPDLAAHFAVLTNAVERRILDGECSDEIYNDFVRVSKIQLIEKLKVTYNNLYDFYYDPSLPTPNWFHGSPPIETFVTEVMDARLVSRKLQIEQELRAFLEGQGFVIQELAYVAFSRRFIIRLRLGIAKVPTTGPREEIGKKLVALESLAV